MSAIMNGIALHGGFIPYGGTFLTFSDYARNAVRMAALMKQGTILVYSHDSIGLGEDGPTHQPIEHLAESAASFRNCRVWRPCDAVETAVAWTAAIERRDGPDRAGADAPDLPHQPRNDGPDCRPSSRGGYVLIDCAGAPECIVIATGSEVGIAAEAVRELQGKRPSRAPGVDALRPSLRCAGRRVSRTRAAGGRRTARGGRSRCDGRSGGSTSAGRGRIIGIDRFGASGKAADLFKHFGFTRERVVEAVEELLGAR